MTTVAYRDGVIAADTLITSDGKRVGYAPKIGRIRSLLYGAAGKLDEMQAFMSWLAGGMNDKSPGDGIVVFDGRIVTFYEQGGRCDWIRTPFYAIGTGRELAMGAMAAGATAEEAVAAALKFDCYSGGEIMSLKAAN